MKTYISLFVSFILLFSTPMRSQEIVPVKYLNDSSQCIQFGLDYLSLRSFDGKSISYQRHYSEVSAMRFGFRFTGSNREQESIRKIFSNDTLISTTEGVIKPSPEVNMELSAQYMWYFASNNDLYLFLTAGPYFGYGQYEYSNTNSKNWFAGLQGSLGAEWFATKNISIHCEYYAKAFYEDSRRKSWEFSVTSKDYYTEENVTSFNLRSGNVLFGISAYF
ncbi:MAG: hypothetical protein AB1728_01770 [Bacteroidota bacterium]